MSSIKKDKYKLDSVSSSSDVKHKKFCDTLFSRLEVILYPSSEIYDCNAVLDELKAFFPEYALILHNQDVSDDGTPKLPHYHFYGRFNGKYRFRGALFLKTFPSLDHISCFPQIKPVKSWSAAIRYTIHADHPDKHQYSQSDIFSNFDVSKFFGARDESERAAMIYDYITGYHCISTDQLMRYCLQNGLYSDLRRAFPMWKSLMKEIAIYREEVN